MVRARAKHISYEFDEQYTPMINEANSNSTPIICTPHFVSNTLAQCHSYYHGLQSDSSGPIGSTDYLVQECNDVAVSRVWRFGRSPMVDKSPKTRHGMSCCCANAHVVGDAVKAGGR